MKPWRIITVFLVLLLGTDASAITCAPKTAVPGFFGVSVSRARYYNPQIGRFWTMDSFEGSQQDPLSLHKYLYCHSDPVNGIDPSGNSMEFDLGALSSTLLGQLGNVYFGSHLASYDASAVQLGIGSSLKSSVKTLQALKFIEGNITNGKQISTYVRESLDNLESQKLMPLSGNCGLAAAALAHAWRGAVISPLGWRQDYGALDTFLKMRMHFPLGEDYENVGFWGIEAQSAIERIMLKAGSGALALVAAYNVKRTSDGEVVGHWFNVVNDGGSVKFLDVSDSASVNPELYFDSMVDFKILVIK